MRCRQTSAHWTQLHTWSHITGHNCRSHITVINSVCTIPPIAHSSALHPLQSNGNASERISAIQFMLDMISNMKYWESTDSAHWSAIHTWEYTNKHSVWLLPSEAFCALCKKEKPGAHTLHWRSCSDSRKRSHDGEVEASKEADTSLTRASTHSGSQDSKIRGFTPSRTSINSQLVWRTLLRWNLCCTQLDTMSYLGTTRALLMKEF